MTEEGVMEREDMDRQFWAFGSGSRLCLGMSLAMESKFSTLVSYMWSTV
jgi:cytochrome P450